MAAKTAEKEKKGNWYVTVKCTIMRRYYVEKVTEQNAKSHACDFASTDLELHQENIEVVRVRKVY